MDDSSLVVESRLDILLWLEGVERPSLFGVPLFERLCSAFSKARLMSLTLTARRLFRLLKTSRISRELELGSGDFGVSEVTEWLSRRSA